MPIRYLPITSPEQKEFIKPTADPSFIYWLFHYKCVVCKCPATEINEIIPRSRSKDSVNEWRNRVPMCRECHRKYHDKGVNGVTIRELQDKRTEFLMSFGRKEYVEFYATRA